MKRWTVGVVLILAMLLFGGCSVSEGNYTDTLVATPLQVETFVFQVKAIEKNYIAADKKCREALEKLQSGEFTKFEANAVFLETGEVIRQSIDAVKVVDAPAELQAVRDDLNFSLVYYQEALKTLKKYLNTENRTVLDKARGQFDKAGDLLKDYQRKMAKLTKKDEKKNKWY